MQDARLWQAALVASLVVLPAATPPDDLSMHNTIELAERCRHCREWDVIYNGTKRERRHVNAATEAEVLAACNISRT